MRHLFLALVLPLAACGGFDCSFPDFDTVEDTVSLRSMPTPSDTLTVVFDLEPLGNVWVGLGAETPRVSESGETELILNAEYGDYEATRVPTLATEVRGDTLLVRPNEAIGSLATIPACEPRDGIVQPVCSPRPAQLDIFVLGVLAPEGVRVVRYFSRDDLGRLAPMRFTPSPEAPASRSVRA